MHECTTLSWYIICLNSLRKMYHIIPVVLCDLFIEIIMLFAVEMKKFVY